DVAEPQQAQANVDGPGLAVLAGEARTARVRALAARAGHDLRAAVDAQARRSALRFAHRAQHFLAEKLAHRQRHLLLLLHELRDFRVLPVQALAARGHRVADVDAARGVVANT